MCIFIVGPTTTMHTTPLIPYHTLNCLQIYRADLSSLQLQFRLHYPSYNMIHITPHPVNAPRSTQLACPRCSRSFNSSEQYIDLTLNSGLQPQVYKKREWAGQEMFRCDGRWCKGEGSLNSGPLHNRC